MNKEILDILIFISAQLITTMVSTAKTILTVEASKSVAAIVNAVSYTLGAILMKLITKQDMTIVISVTFFANLFGVYLAKLIIEKTRKDKLWIVNATVKNNISDDVEGELLNRGIQYTLLPARNHRDFFTIFSNSQGESLIIKEILKKYNIKHSVVETENF